MESLNWLNLGQLKYLMKKPKIGILCFTRRSGKNFPEKSVQKIFEHLWRSLQICSRLNVAVTRSLQILNQKRLTDLYRFWRKTPLVWKKKKSCTNLASFLQNMVFLQASCKPMPVLQESCKTMQILQGDELEYQSCKNLAKPCKSCKTTNELW